MFGLLLADRGTCFLEEDILLYLMLISINLIDKVTILNVTRQCLTAVKFVVEMGHSV